MILLQCHSRVRVKAWSHGGVEFTEEPHNLCFRYINWISFRMNFLNVPTHAPKAASYCQTIWALKSQRKLLAGRRTESIHLSIISPAVDVTGPLRVTVSVKAGNTRYSFSHWQGAMMLLNANKVAPHVWVLTERWERYVSRSRLRWGKNVVQHGKMAECSVKVSVSGPHNRGRL